MPFSKKQFAEAFASLLPTDPLEKRVVDPERRRARRIELKFRTRLLLVGASGDPAIDVELRDVSVRGLRFVHDRPLSRDQQFIVAIPQAGGEPQLLLCTVMHSRKADEGSFTVGAEITCALPRRVRAKPAPRTSRSR